MDSCRINVFQRLVRQWDEIHPYNAAQVLKIAGAPSMQRLQDAWHDAMNDLGLGRVRMDGGSYHYECLNGEMSLYGVRRVPAGVTFEDFISEHLNRRFDNPSEPPFRPFVVVEGDSYYAGVVYHHWVADSVSIRTLLREWFVRVYDPAAARREPMKLADSGYRSFFKPEQHTSAMGHGLVTAARWCSSLRHARRLDIGNGIDLAVRFGIRQAPKGWITELHTAARKRGVTLNDLFMAAIAKVCEQHVPMKLRPRRQSVAIGSIVDLRPYSDGELDDAFGLFLGFTNVVCKPAELRDPERLVKAIATQTALQKQRGVPQASALRMLAGVAMGRFVAPDRMPQFYQKYLPLAGGISNVNMNRSWAMAYHPSPLQDYIRVSPTGPMMPVVFATTTVGESFHVGLTYRPSVVPREKIDAVLATFWNCLAVLM